MKKIEFELHNFYPDFMNQNVIKKGKDLIKNIKTKNVNNFEIFCFHELAANFDNENLIPSNVIASNIFNHQFDYIFVCSSQKIENNFSLAFNFLFNENILSNYKSKLIFLNESESLNSINNKIAYFKNMISNKKIGLILLGHKSFSNNFFNICKHLINIMQIEYNYYNAIDSIFLIGKQSFENQFSFVGIKENNTLIVPNILPDNYSFFSETNLVLLLLQGVDLDELFEGYRQGSQEWTSLNLQDNYAFQYAYSHIFCFNENKKIFINITNRQYVKNILAEMSVLKNHYYNNKAISVEYTYPNDIDSFLQYSMDNNKKILLNSFVIENENYDYRLTDDVNENDQLKPLQLNINSISLASKNILHDLIMSVSNIYSIELILKNNSSISLGYLMSFIYWSTLFEKYLLESNF